MGIVIDVDGRLNSCPPVSCPLLFISISKSDWGTGMGPSVLTSLEYKEQDISLWVCVSGSYKAQMSFLFLSGPIPCAASVSQ